MRLYDLPGAFHAIGERIRECDGEITPEIEAELEALEIEATDKFEGVGAVIRECEAEAAAWKAERDRLDAHYRTAANKAERLKRYAHETMQRMNVTKVETPRFKFRIQRNGRPSIRWVGAPEKLPAQYRRVVESVDGEAAYQDYRAGELAGDGWEITEGSHLRLA